MYPVQHMLNRVHSLLLNFLLHFIQIIVFIPTYIQYFVLCKVIKVIVIAYHSQTIVMMIHLILWNVLPIPLTER